MAIKGGQIIHVGDGVTLIDRIQSAGPGQLNIPTEKIYELGNYRSVATIRDVPDLSFSLESLDVSTEIETMLTRAYAGRTVTDGVSTTDPTFTSATASFVTADVGRMVIITKDDGSEFVTTVASRTNGTTVELTDATDFSDTALTFRIVENGIDLATSNAVDIAGQFKAGITAADPTLVIASVATPYLSLEQMSYRFGLRDNATQTATLRGDTIFYNPGACFVEETAGSGSGGQAVVSAHSAYQLAEGDERRVLSVCAGGRRLTFGADYVESYGSISGGAAVTTVTITDAVATTDLIRIMYSSPTTVQYAQGVHPDTTVKPAAVRGRDIEIYVGGYDPNDIAGSQVNKTTSVQSVTVDWRVTLDKDEEFGNYYAVAYDFDVPAVNGSIDIKPRDNADLLTTLRQITGVSDATKVIGPSTAVPLEVDVVIKHPDTGAVIKRLHVPDARFTVPGYTGRVQQKTTVTLPFESDEGSLTVFER